MADPKEIAERFLLATQRKRAAEQDLERVQRDRARFEEEVISIQREAQALALTKPVFVTFGAQIVQIATDGALMVIDAVAGTPTAPTVAREKAGSMVLSEEAKARLRALPPDEDEHAGEAGLTEQPRYLGSGPTRLRTIPVDDPDDTPETDA